MTKFMKFKDCVDTIFDWISTAAKFFSACLLIVMICAVSVQVVGRVLEFRGDWYVFPDLDDLHCVHCRHHQG